MRKLVINTIVDNFIKGKLDELGGYKYRSEELIDFLDKTDKLYTEWKSSGKYIPFGEYWKLNIDEDKFRNILNNLSDEALLDCLRGQHCLAYR